MKANLHPKLVNTQVSCACGNTFTIRATVPEIKVEVCSKCHPFYTGQMKYVDTAGRVDAFSAKMAKKSTKKVLSKTEKRRLKKVEQLKREMNVPQSLDEIRRLARKMQKKVA